MMKIQRLLFLLMISTFFCWSAEAAVTLPRIFSENMVLQREAAIPVWGWAKPNEKITVRFNKQTQTTLAGQNGKWSLKLAAEKAGGPFEIIVSGENTIKIENVLVGEVWLCSGQSNMEWTVGQSDNAAEELAASDNPLIREIKISRAVNSNPQEDIKEGSWKVSNPVNTKDFSAAAYFFAVKLYKELKVPVGIINSTWGGTNIETWISREGFESSDEFKAMIGRMPKLDFESLTKLKLAQKNKLIESMQGFKPEMFDAEAFKKESFDESKLPELNVPAQWEGQGLGDLDGIVWLRKVVRLTAEQSRKPAVIELAKIDDQDNTFINGIEIGKTNQWDAPRKYQIPAGVLKEGKNVIAVKVTDTGGGGGIYGDAAKLNLVLGAENIALAGKWKFQVENIRVGSGENEFPSLAFNAMINPLVPYSIRGVLWYQGEANADRAFQYRTAFPLLINDWRKKWQSEFPFYYVQLATYTTGGNSNEGSGWAELREAQTMTLKLPKTGMVVTTDIGNPKDIHPTNKQEVGRRLAALALRDIFKKALVASGPSFKAMKIEGNKAVVSFEDFGGGLTATGASSEVFGFEIAGRDQVFYPAKAVIKDNTVIVSSAKITDPVAVRFGWLGDASADNLFNKEGFPAVPFRTDEWKTVTKDAKYQFMEIK